MRVLVTLEAVEGLAAVEATIERLAGRRAEAADFFGMHRPAARTLRGLLAKALSRRPFRRRCDAVGMEFFAACVADPVRRPGWRQHGFDFHPVETRLIQSFPNLSCNRKRRRTTTVCRRDKKRVPVHFAYDAEIHDRYAWNLWIGNLAQDCQHALLDLVLRQAPDEVFF